MIRVSTVRLPAYLEREYRFALVADTHNVFPEELVQILAGERPDGILMTGDLVHRWETFRRSEAPMNFLKRCASIAPTFYSRGNHEYAMTPEDQKRLEAAGITVLDDRWTRLGSICIGGLTSGFRGPKEHPDGRTEPNPQVLAEFDRQSGYKLLLCHHPEYYDRYIRDTGINLTVSGHAHGGQICLWGQGLYAPGQGLLPKYTSGVHENRLVISRGLRNTAFPIPRLWNPREVVMIHLIPN